MVKRISLLLLTLLVCVASFSAGEHSNSQARQVFEKAYQQVFGPKGCSLHYDVNLVGVYKTTGNICYKGKKSRFTDEKVDSWCDGVTAYIVYRKKKIVEIHDANSDKRDKYASKFKFSLDDFDYSMEQTAEGVLLTLKQHRDAKGTVKHAKALLDEKTLAPIWLKIKVAFFWANISITNFKVGGINDNVFVFPRANYGKDYKFVDKR